MDQKSNETSFVYTTYIHATPERVWQGLTDPTFTSGTGGTRSRAGSRIRTDWQKGSAYDVAYDEVGLVITDPGQVILESDPYAVSPTPGTPSRPEWAAAHRFDEVTVGRLAGRAAFEGRLRHRGGGRGRGEADRGARRLRAGERRARGRARRVAAVVASLKTLLETGSALPST